MKKIILIALCLVNVLNYQSIYLYFQNKNTFEIIMLNVGQGDAMLIKTPNNYYGLIDVGLKNTSLNKLKEILPIWVSKIDFIVITHPHEDHFGDLINIIENYNVKNIFMNKYNGISKTYQGIVDIVENNKISNFSILQNNDFKFDNVSFKIIWPKSLNDIFSVENINLMSTGILISYQNLDILNLGDLEGINEIDSVKELENVSIEILKVSHHGSKTSSSKEFLEKIHPKFSLISVAENNNYGHPSQEVINNLEKISSEIYRTDKDGDIKISYISNNNLTIKTAKSEFFKEF